MLSTEYSIHPSAQLDLNIFPNARLNGTGLVFSISSSASYVTEIKIALIALCLDVKRLNLYAVYFCRMQKDEVHFKADPCE